MTQETCKVGRPSLYRDEYAQQVEKLCKLGATDKEIAEFFEIAESTLNAWKLDYPEFSEALKNGKTIADAEVASKLFHRATGYEHGEDDIRAVNGEIVITPTVKHYPPDTTAAIFWLKNRQRGKWTDKVDHELSGGVEVKKTVSAQELTDDELAAIATGATK